MLIVEFILPSPALVSNATNIELNCFILNHHSLSLTQYIPIQIFLLYLPSPTPIFVLIIDQKVVHQKILCMDVVTSEMSLNPYKKLRIHRDTTSITKHSNISRFMRTVFPTTIMKFSDWYLVISKTQLFIKIFAIFIHR